MKRVFVLSLMRLVRFGVAENLLELFAQENPVEAIDLVQTGFGRTLNTATPDQISTLLGRLPAVISKFWQSELGILRKFGRSVKLGQSFGLPNFRTTFSNRARTGRNKAMVIHSPPEVPPW